MKYILLLIFLLISSCGKNSIIVNLKNKKSDTAPPLRYYLTNQEYLIDQYDVLEIVDLRLIVPDLENLPIEVESFEAIHHALGNYSKIYQFNRGVLKSGDDCHALIGYCYAYLIFKPRPQ